MLIALTTLFLLTAISFAIIVMTMTLRDSWNKVMVALVPVDTDPAVRTARRAKRITRRPANYRSATALRVAA